MQNQKQQQPKQSISKIWDGDTVLCIASGPSLDTDDIDYARGKCRTIVINDNYQLAPWADILYACDLKWWVWHKGAPDFEGLKYTMDKKAAEKYSLNYIEGGPGNALSDMPDKIHTGSNSGAQAINMAFLLGAKRIVLTGYDMKIAKSGASHWFGDHPDQTRSPYVKFIQSFEQIAKQNLVEIVNCTRDTALTCFPQMNIRDAL
jgi:hypothetical protein